ncbi:hypothetical protein ACFXJ5_39155 [Streptomyces sp. NPDC059373]
MPTTQDIDLSGLSAERGGSQPLRGYLARPSEDEHGAGPWPGVVVVHEMALALRFEQLAVAFWVESAQGGAGAVHPTVPT